MNRLACLILMMLTALGFQNCQKAGFNSNADVLSMNTFSADTAYATTEMNTPVDFSLKASGPLNGVQVSFSPGNPAGFKGKFELLDASLMKIRYTPDFGFRGHDTASVSITDAYGTQLSVYAIVNVGNPLSALEPALAVRGMGCIQCHANVASNIITDFGYGSPFYFGGQAPSSKFNWKNGSIYGDHGPSFSTVLTAPDKSVIVPRAAVPAPVGSETSATSLADYVRRQLAASPEARTKLTKVVEKSRVYIGAPTDANLISTFHLGSPERRKYYPNEDSSPALSGLADQGNYFRIVGRFACDGDLVIRGPLYIENMELDTINGCRMYVIGSVFQYGALRYANAQPHRNLQITSSRSINMGLGEVKRNGGFCESGSRYETDPAGYGTSSLKNRLQTFWTVPANYVRQASDPTSFGASVVQEANLIAAAQGPLYDAACRPEGRSIGFERLLINAPIIHGRYQGDFKGTVIAEQATMSLGAFIFEFDPVFNEVPVLPFLDPNLYLSLSN